MFRVLTGLAATLFVAISCPAAVADGFDIIVGAGQSNGKQPGKGAWYDPYALSQIDARIKQLGRYEAALQIVDVNPNPTQCGDSLRHWNTEPCMAGHGHLLAFARRYAATELAPGRRVLIIPAARGNTSILEWNNKLIVNPESSLLYSDMVGRIRYALSFPESRIVSFNLSLGETDVYFASKGLHEMTVEKFRTELREFLSNLRTNLPGDYPILANKMAPSFRSWDPIKAAIDAEIQMAVQGFDPFGSRVNSDGLATNPGEPHFTAASMVILGQRFYTRWRAMMGFSARAEPR